MADQINVDPTPIQRNRRDVAIELVGMYLRYANLNSSQITEDKLGNLYSKYYKIVLDAERGK